MGRLIKTVYKNYIIKHYLVDSFYLTKENKGARLYLMFI